MFFYCLKAPTCSTSGESPYGDNLRLKQNSVAPTEERMLGRLVHQLRKLLPQPSSSTVLLPGYKNRDLISNSTSPFYRSKLCTLARAFPCPRSIIECIYSHVLNMQIIFHCFNIIFMNTLPLLSPFHSSLNLGENRAGK